MLRSMTGYGRAQKYLHSGRITIELQSLNHRYCDIEVFLPRSMLYVESGIRDAVSKVIGRGRVRVFVHLEGRTMDGQCLVFDQELARSYFDGLRKVAREVGVKGELDAGLMPFIIKDIVSTRHPRTSETRYRKLIAGVLETALQKLIAMKDREGKVLSRELRSGIRHIVSATRAIKIRIPKTLKGYSNKLKREIKGMIRTKMDEERMLREIAGCADRLDVTEEIVRLESHTQQFLEVMEKTGPVGKTLDFIVQEMMREVNTIGAKVSDIQVSKTVIEIKGELEKIREQIQNVE